MQIFYRILIIRYTYDVTFTLFYSTISHDMRLISQCAQEIMICDLKKVTKYRGDILDFKMKTKKDNNKKLAQHQNG